MTKTDKFIEDLKANGYQEGDLSTLPSGISNADRKKVEQHEADLANEQMKAYRGQKPELSEFHVELNPNQYGYADRIEAPTQQAKPDKEAQPKAKREPFGGKGDHDNSGKVGGAAKPVDNADSGDKK